MRVTATHARLRRFAMFLVAGLTVLQLGLANARPVDLCCAEGCDEPMPCQVSPCTACAPLPAIGAGAVARVNYLAEVQPPVAAGKIPVGEPADIWRPPPARMIDA